MGATPSTQKENSQFEAIPNWLELRVHVWNRSKLEKTDTHSSPAQPANAQHGGLE
jgi:hypothetical protein